MFRVFLQKWYEHLLVIAHQNCLRKYFKVHIVFSIMSCYTPLGEIMKFEDIKTRNELAEFMGIPLKRLTHILFKEKTENCYNSFDIPKKRGGYRRINAPKKKLKYIQKRLSEKLFEVYIEIGKQNGYRYNISHAFEKRKSIMTNARIHKNKKIVVNLDLLDFFDTFHIGRVCGYFEKNENFKLPHIVAATIAQIACYNGKLPQGSPCSPIITNLICQAFDMRLLKISKKFKLDYTRYADDLTFSTNDKKFLEIKEKFFEEIEKEILKLGFKVNPQKTRLVLNDSRQEVTGLIVNEKLGVKTEFVKKTRAMAHNLYARGNFFIEDGLEGSIEQLQGRFAFIDQVDKFNNKNNKNKNSYLLNSREKQYQLFLFYKIFFATDSPVIITEGKTDIIYLKAALKSLHKDYPKLVTKDKNGKFRYKITFLNRNSKLAYFFRMSGTGADAMMNLYRFCCGKDNRPDYYDYFETKFNVIAKAPVLFLFDNELKNKDKPLYKFVRFIKNNNLVENIEDIRSDLLITLKSNVFLITNQLMNGKDECEIEDLFLQDVLGTELKGKRFCRKDKYDINKFYGKEVFSKHVISKYQTIDFSNFKPILDNIVKSIELWENIKQEKLKS